MGSEALLPTHVLRPSARIDSQSVRLSPVLPLEDERRDDDGEGRGLRRVMFFVIDPGPPMRNFPSSSHNKRSLSSKDPEGAY